jgi:DNA repair exonuclease SbcCD ATPase subunit
MEILQNRLTEMSTKMETFQRQLYVESSEINGRFADRVVANVKEYVVSSVNQAFEERLPTIWEVFLAKAKDPNALVAPNSILVNKEIKKLRKRLNKLEQKWKEETAFRESRQRQKVETQQIEPASNQEQQLQQPAKRQRQRRQVEEEQIEPASNQEQQLQQPAKRKRQRQQVEEEQIEPESSQEQQLRQLQQPAKQKRQRQQVEEEQIEAASNQEQQLRQLQQPAKLKHQFRNVEEKQIEAASAPAPDHAPASAGVKFDRQRQRLSKSQQFSDSCASAGKLVTDALAETKKTTSAPAPPPAATPAPATASPVQAKEPFCRTCRVKLGLGHCAKCIHHKDNPPPMGKRRRIPKNV